MTSARQIWVEVGLNKIHAHSLMGLKVAEILVGAGELSPLNESSLCTLHWMEDEALEPGVLYAGPWYPGIYVNCLYGGPERNIYRSKVRSQGMVSIILLTAQLVLDLPGVDQYEVGPGAGVGNSRIAPSRIGGG